jgi:hypothetical protein
LRGRPTWTVAGSVALNSPTLSECPDIDRVEPELVNQFCDGSLCRDIVSRDGQPATIIRAVRLLIGEAAGPRRGEVSLKAQYSALTPVIEM